RTPVEHLEKLLEGKRPAARAATSMLMSPISTRSGHRAQQAGKTALWRIVPCVGMGAGALRCKFPESASCPEASLDPGGPYPPVTPCRVARRRAVFPSGACAASFE